MWPGGSTRPQPASRGIWRCRRGAPRLTRPRGSVLSVALLPGGSPVAHFRRGLRAAPRSPIFIGVYGQSLQDSVGPLPPGHIASSKMTRCGRADPRGRNQQAAEFGRGNFRRGLRDGQASDFPGDLREAQTFSRGSTGRAGLGFSRSVDETRHGLQGSEQRAALVVEGSAQGASSGSA